MQFTEDAKVAIGNPRVYEFKGSMPPEDQKTKFRISVSSELRDRSIMVWVETWLRAKEAWCVIDSTIDTTTECVREKMSKDEPPVARVHKIAFENPGSPGYRFITVHCLDLSVVLTV